MSPPKCETCDKKYSREAIPLVLDCGHTYCEGCIMKWGRLVKNSGNITCPDCSKCHYIESVKSIKQLQINSHIYGIITAPSRTTENAIDSIVKDLTNKLNEISMSQAVEDNEEYEENDEEFPSCCECNGKADVWCNECNLNYCFECSGQVHKLVALKSHTQQPCQTQSIFQKCSFHPNSVPTHSLVLSGESVCPECPPCGETVPIMCDPEHIEDIIHQHNLALDRLLESDKDAADIIPVVEDDFSRIRQGLSKEYAYFHGLLQARERTQLEKLEIDKTKIIQPLLDARCDIARANKVTRSNFNWILKNKDTKRVLIKQQKRVQEIKQAIDNTKCTLYVLSEKRPTITTKKCMLSQCITEFCKLNTDNVHEYTLDTVESRVGKKFREEAKAFGTPEKYKGWEPPFPAPSQPVEPLTVKLADPDNHDKVIVSEVYSPHHFYVQRVKDRNDLDELQNILVKYYGLSATSDDFITAASLNELVCCQFTVDDLWYRARITGVQDRLVDVLYIDYGNSETVPLSRLRRMKAQFTHCPAMAIKCSIFGVTPRDGQDWTEESSITLQRLSAETEFEMLTKGKIQDCMQVDLLQSVDDIGSIREFLVFTEHACFGKNDKITSPDEGEMEIDSVQVESTPKSWPQPTRDEVDASEYVSINVTYIIHPLHFYVKLCDEDDSAKLCSDIEVHMTSVGRNFPLKELKKGIMCLSFFPTDGSFYRATILGARDLKVEVFYCDFGNTELVHRSDLYEVTNTLAAPPAQAIKCKLRGVKPVEEAWTEDNVTVFDNLVGQQKTLFALPSSTDEDRCTEVLLIDTTKGEEDVEISKEMVRRGAALPDQGLIEEEKEVTGDLCLGELNTTRDVTICYLTSPHMIHVNLADHPYPPFFTKLNTAYARLVKNKNQIIERDTTWNVGDMCVAFIKEMGLYVRGQITSFTLPQCAQVENIDQGKISKVSISDLKILIEDFSTKSAPKFAVTCRLFDILPPSGDDWTPEEHKLVMKYLGKRVKKRKATCTVTVKKEPGPGESVWEVDMFIKDLATGANERVSDGLRKIKLAKPILKNVVTVPEGSYENMVFQGPKVWGKVRHVNNECVVFYTPDYKQYELKIVSACLSQSNGFSYGAEVRWGEGDPCVVKLESESYRGMIKHMINSKTLLVVLVDVGTEHQVHVRHVSPTLLCPDIPKLAVPFILTDVLPAWHTSGGSWTTPARIYLYEKVVNEKCKIEVMGKEGDCYRARMTLLNGEDISGAMVNKGFAVSCPTNFTSTPDHTPQLPPVSDHIPPVSDHIPPVSDHIPPVSDHAHQLPPVSDHIPPVSNRIPSESDHTHQLPPVSDHIPPVSNHIHPVLQPQAVSQAPNAIQAPLRLEQPNDPVTANDILPVDSKLPLLSKEASATHSPLTNSPLTNTPQPNSPLKNSPQPNSPLTNSPQTNSPAPLPSQAIADVSSDLQSDVTTPKSDVTALDDAINRTETPYLDAQVSGQTRVLIGGELVECVSQIQP